MLILKKTIVYLLVFLSISSFAAKAPLQSKESNHKNSKQLDVGNNNKVSKSKTLYEPKLGKYVAVKDKSTIKFLSTAKMLGIESEVTGQFTDFSISATKGDILDNSNIEVVIAAKSIDTDNARRDKHLRSADFFDAKKYKEIVFKSKKFRHIKTDRFEVSGDLKIKSKVTNITFEVSVAPVEPSVNTIWRIKGKQKFNRNNLGIDYKSPFFLPDVGDEITVIFDVVLSFKQ